MTSRITHVATRLLNIKTILIAFLILGTIYSVVTPIFEASDELWHYPLVQWLSKGNPLPVQDAKNVGPWKQEASQPPLYYWLMGWSTFWIDTSDMAQVRQENPHVDNGVITPDGNRNLVIHNPQTESFPWRGTVLAVHLARLLSVLMGAATVWLTYKIALEIFADRPWLALGAAAVNAFTPMFLFISGAVNNDNLTMTLCSLGLLLMVKRVREYEGSGIRDQGLAAASSCHLQAGLCLSVGTLAAVGHCVGPGRVDEDQRAGAAADHGIGRQRGGVAQRIVARVLGRGLRDGDPGAAHRGLVVSA